MDFPDNLTKDTKLFMIGEAAKAMNVTRKMILNYEECGLLTPALKEQKSGYRYYTADNLAQIRLIRMLQGLGMSLPEIRGYLDDKLQLSDIIKRLELLRNQLDISIAKLHVRADVSGEPQFYWTILPRQTSYCKKMNSMELTERTVELRNTYIEAVRKYRINHEGYMFTELLLSDKSDRKMFIPVEDDSTGEFICVTPETRAICTYYRGAYENIPEALENLLEYVHKKGFEFCGAARSIYMEGPPNRGNDKANYITQIAVPVEDEFEDIPRG